MKKRKFSFDGMLVATFLTTIFYSSTYPYIHKHIISEVSEDFLALNQILNCLSTIVYGYIWNKTDKIFKYCSFLCVFECLTTIGTTLFCIFTKNIVAYYIMDTLAFALITRNFICAGAKLKAMRYRTEKEREHFDNNNCSVSAAATIIGASIAMVLNLNFETMLCLATLGNAIDNFIYVFIYEKEKKKEELRWKELITQSIIKAKENV